MEKKTKITGPIFIGRSWMEYIKMFDLDLKNLKNQKILDCAAGASSFTSYMHKQDFEVTAVDLIYDKSPEFLQLRCQKHLQALIDALEKMKQEFVWTFFHNLDELKKHRIKSCQDFYQDYKSGKGKRYLKGDLTNLPFDDNSFDLLLCAHLLFIYDHRLSEEFHHKAVEEMMRVTRKELRLYPLVKHKGLKSTMVEKVTNSLSDNYKSKLVKVDYQFRKGGNQMLVISKT